MTLYREIISQIELKTYKPKSVEELVDLYMNAFLQDNNHYPINIKVEMVYLFSYRNKLRYSHRAVKSAVLLWDFDNRTRLVSYNVVDRWLDSLTNYENSILGKYAKEYFREWEEWCKEQGHEIKLKFRSEWLIIFRSHPRVVQGDRVWQWGYKYKIADVNI